jgi:hypothetical protein
MSVYDPLQRELTRTTSPAVTLSFAQIEGLIGRSLPKSAYEYEAWWSNEDGSATRHSQCRAWKLAGFNAQANRSPRTVTFPGNLAI